MGIPTDFLYAGTGTGKGTENAKWVRIKTNRLTLSVYP